MVRVWLRVVAGLVGVAILGACSDSVLPGGGMVVDTEAAVEVAVVASEGETLETVTGHKLAIPAGALAEDTTIKMTPFRFSGGETLDVLAGVELLPHGLELATPATLTMPLAVSGEPDAGYRLLTGDEIDRPAAETGTLFVADATGGAASGDIWSFSCKYIMKNCHAATRDWLFAGWQGVLGYDQANIQDRLGFSVREMTTCEFGRKPLDSLLLAYFTQCGTAEPGEPIGAAGLAAMQSTLDEGRQVAVVFRTRWLGPPQSLSIIKHSGVVFDNAGELHVRHHLQLEVDEFELLHERGDSPILEVPLSHMTNPGELRDLRTGEARRIYVEKTGLLPAERRILLPRVWGHATAYCENERTDHPDQATLPDPVLRCTDAGGGDQDRCDAMCDGGFKGTTMTATDNGGTCGYKLEFETKPGASFMFAFRGQGRWDAMQVGSHDLTNGINLDAPVDMIMGLYFDGTCPQVWVNLACCFAGTCGPSAGCTPDPAEVGLSSQVVPLVECAP